MRTNEPAESYVYNQRKQANWYMCRAIQFAKNNSITLQIVCIPVKKNVSLYTCYNAGKLAYEGSARLSAEVIGKCPPRRGILCEQF